MKRDSLPDAGATHIDKPTSVFSPETDSRQSLLLQRHVAAGLVAYVGPGDADAAEAWDPQPKDALTLH